MTIGGTALGASLVWPPIPLSALKKVGEEILRGAKEKAERKGVTDVESELVEGDPAEVILQAIEKDRADMVIMGMRGLGEVAGMLLGSVSYKVNHLAPCTCVTVR
jgi:nucleotide-binding universal stress UspA family protein